jgi:TonB-dependent SusC/RagA subfamily outer membrane receptor
MISTPNDIESVKVLKGASAAALWGYRASNGVLNHNQKGKRGKISVDYISSSVSLIK